TSSTEAIERRFDRHVVLTVARLNQRELNTAAITFGKTAVGNADLSIVHRDRRRQRAELITVHDEPADGNFAVEIWRRQLPADVAVESELSAEFDSVATHLLFDFRQKSRRDQNSL